MKALISRRRALSRFLPTVCVLLWVSAFVATHVPARRVPPTQFSDKTLHAVGYFALGVAFLMAMWSRGVSSRTRAVVAACVIPAYGALDELTQPLVNRTAAWSDWAADLVGAAAAITALEGVLWLMRRFGGARRGVDGSPGPK